MFDQIVARITAQAEPLPWEVVLALGGVALLVTWVPLGYALVRHGVTVFHEAGHALIAALVGRKLSGIKLHSDTSGLTISKGKPRGFGMVLTFLAGYPAPAVVATLGAVLLSLGYAAGMLWAMLGLAVLLLLLVRNLYGLWVILVMGAGLGALVWWATPSVITGAAYLVVWMLLLAAPRSVVELQIQRRRTKSKTSDADQLAKLTRVPAVVWVGIFWLLCVACLAASLTLLLGYGPVR